MQAGGSPAPGLWQNRSFVLLFGAQIVSLFGSGVTTVALALLAAELAGPARAPAVLGMALMLRILAFLLVSQPAGVVADRWPRKPLLLGADVCRCALVALLPLASSIGAIYALVFLVNAATAVFSPVYEATLPDVVGRTDYVRAMTFSRVAVDIEAVASPAVAALLLGWVELRTLFYLDAITYLVSAVLLLAVALPGVIGTPRPLSVRELAAELSFGARVLLRQPALRRALVLAVAEATAGAAAIVATVSYVTVTLRSSERAFLLAMAAVGLGSALTAVSLGRAVKRYEREAQAAELHLRRHRWTTVALATAGALLSACLLPGALMPPLAVFIGLWLLNGAGQALIAVSSATLLAEHTQPGERGRAYAAHFAITHLWWLITYPSVGWASARWGAPVTFTALGAICAAIAVAAWLASPALPAAHDHPIG